MSLRRRVKDLSGQDVYQCQACTDCDQGVWSDMDIPFSSVVQLVLQNDVEVLHSRTVESDAALELARGACKRGLNLHAMILALRHIESERAISH